MCRKTSKEDLSTNSCHYLTNKKIPETYIKRYHFFVSGIRYVERVNLFSVLIEEVHHLLQILLAVHIKSMSAFRHNDTLTLRTGILQSGTYSVQSAISLELLLIQALPYICTTTG